MGNGKWENRKGKVKEKEKGCREGGCEKRGCKKKKEKEKEHGK